MDIDTFALSAILSLGLGSAFGWVVERSGFCTMGAISDLVIFQSNRRLKVWALAVATAALGLTVWPAGAPALGGVSLGQLALAATGGLIFGYGMVLTGGCVSRCLVRTGAGSVKAALVLVVLFATALLVLTGLNPTPIMVAERIQNASDTGPVTRLVPALLAACLLVWILNDRRFRRFSTDTTAGLVMGFCVVMVFIVDDIPQASGLNFLDPVAAPSGYVAVSGVSLLVGTVLGASLSAAARGSFRLEFFVDRADIARNGVGALFLGLGGALVGACTVGAGMSGVASLSLAAIVATAAMMAGAAGAVQVLLAGGLGRFAGRIGGLWRRSGRM
ncbi:MAG: YeeE/YedE thiosulfate transporter family protein [Geminicoccaceae bacterium]